MMKKLIYLSGILGGILLLFRIIGIFTEFHYNDYLLVAGTFLIVIVFLPLSVVERIQHKRKIDKIIHSYKGTAEKSDENPRETRPTNGWTMNNSPFRDRKSGVSWGGGNIKGANASRQSRKRFLK